MHQQPTRLSLLTNRLQQIFTVFMHKQEVKYSISQKKIFLLLFCILIAAIHIIRLFGLGPTNTTSGSIPAHISIATPNMIILPDSLNITLIRQYQQMKLRQDSLTHRKEP